MTTYFQEMKKKNSTVWENNKYEELDERPVKELRLTTGTYNTSECI